MQKENHAQRHDTHQQSGGAMNKRPYLRLLLMTVLSFISMYVLMYAMVNSFANVYSNLNQYYMAGLMTAPMVLIELALMGRMYQDKKLNATIAVLSLVALVGFWFLIRQQTAIADRQFLKSMIPHHAGAILMCREAALADAEIKELCAKIIADQEAEIRQMKEKLSVLEK
jgi:Na+/melibiose symporter-like transporter